ncbi:diguanylate cyclase [Rhizobium sp. RM]|uniref:diguanylate cyclase n=1 Tax=Rhizobium sp. RM TaxID=2748079 RepID=UPI00110F11A6|nr:diguanylate cyclase [Rhizobium sp. RM]NWJ26366.1 diguanylate cyclase [Rhizobium sp. RM]TMV19859.1 diguanylate cyclase [Rhizobium sp. Td3]
MSLWHQLLPNLAVVAITTSIWTLGHRHVEQLRWAARTTIFSVVMAGGVLATMALPFEWLPGVLLDARYTLLAISAYFGGPFAAVLPFATAVIRRLSTGGTGVYTAIPQIVAASAGGVVLHYMFRNHLASTRATAILAVWAGVSATAGFYVVYPVANWPSLTLDATGPLAIIVAGATLLSGLAIVQEHRRHAATVENRRYRQVIEALPDCLNAKDEHGQFLLANPATAKMMGTGVNELIGKTDADYYPSETANMFREPEELVLSSGRPVTVEQQFIGLNGSETWLSTLKAPLLDVSGNIIGIVTHNREITDRKRLEQRLARTQTTLIDAIESMADGLAMFDGSGILVLHNRRYHELFPLTADVRVPGKCLREIIQASLERGEEPEAVGNISDLVERTADVLMRNGDRIVKLADGRWIEANSRTTEGGGVMIVYSDVTANRDRENRLRDLNERLTALASTDSLTGLVNRRAFDDAMRSAVSHAVAKVVPLSVLMIDVDHFKAYNDGYGHVAGDECLQQVAAALSRVFLPFEGAVTARYGGEEFAVILPRALPQEAIAMGAMAVAAVRAQAIEHHFSEKGVVTISIGIATDRGSSEKPAELLKCADAALYAAKAAGRDCARTEEKLSPILIANGAI